MLAVAAVYDGPADEGEAAVQPLRELGNPVLDFSGKVPYCAIQGLYDGLFPKGRDRNGAFCYVPLDIAMDVARCHVQPVVRRKWLVWLLFVHTCT